VTTKKDDLTRRQAIGAGLVGAAGIATLPALLGDGPKKEAQTPGVTAQDARQPVVYLPHGGGPWPFVEMGLNQQEVQRLTAYLTTLPQAPARPPRALLVISAHWEEPVWTVMTGARPPLLFDYYGFPPASYELTWPAPGDPALAERVRGLLAQGGLPTGTDAARGFDHGTFVPLKLAFPEAQIPTVQLSLKKGLDPEEHLAMGRLLAPLRDEGVFIVGSGMSFHNMRAFGDPRAKGLSEPFDQWLNATALLPAAERDRRLGAWAEAPGARLSHPREEHLLPLMVIAGAAGSDLGKSAFQGSMMGAQISALQFG